MEKRKNRVRKVSVYNDFSMLRINGKTEFQNPFSVYRKCLKLLRTEERKTAYPTGKKDFSILFYP